MYSWYTNVEPYQWRIRYFPDGGRGNPWFWSENLLFGKAFAENCMKMKEIGPKGGGTPLDPPMPINGDHLDDQCVPGINMILHTVIPTFVENWKRQ